MRDATLLVVHMHHFGTTLGCKYPKVRDGIFVDVKYSIYQCCCRNLLQCEEINALNFKTFYRCNTTMNGKFRKINDGVGD